VPDPFVREPLAVEESDRPGPVKHSVESPEVAIARIVGHADVPKSRSPWGSASTTSRPATSKEALTWPRRGG